MLGTPSGSTDAAVALSLRGCGTLNFNNSVLSRSKTSDTLSSPAAFKQFLYSHQLLTNNLVGHRRSRCVVAHSVLKPELAVEPVDSFANFRYANILVLSLLGTRQRQAKP